MREGVGTEEERMWQGRRRRWTPASSYASLPRATSENVGLRLNYK